MNNEFHQWILEHVKSHSVNETLKLKLKDLSQISVNQCSNEKEMTHEFLKKVDIF